MSSTERLEAASISITSIEVPGGDRHAGLAFAARGHGRAAAFAVQRAGEDLRHRGLAGPARADEQVGVVDLVLLDRVAQRADDVRLPDDLVEGAGAMAAVKGRGLGAHKGLQPVYPRPRRGSPLQGRSVGLAGRLPPVAESPQVAHAGGVGGRRHGGAADRLPGRLPQLRHDLRTGLGTGTGPRASAPTTAPPCPPRRIR